MGQQGKIKAQNYGGMYCEVHFKYQHQKHPLWMDFSLALLCPFMTPCLMVIYFQASGDSDENRIELGGHFA